MKTEIYRDDQYLIETDLDISALEHASNLKEVAYGTFLNFLNSAGLTKEEALARFENLKKREAELQVEMLSEINKLG